MRSRSSLTLSLIHIFISMLIFAMLMTACGGGGSKSVFTEPGAIGKIMGELQNKDGLKGQELKVFQDITILSLIHIYLSRLL